MTDKFDDIVDNLKQPSHWVRLPFMLAFGFVLYLIFVPVVLVVMAAQILFALLTGESNRNLRGLGSVVQQYVSQIVDYITYNSDTRPYPFSDFPMDGFEAENSGEEETESVPAAKPLKKESKPSKATPKKAKKSATTNTSGADQDTSQPSKAAAKKKPVKKKAAVKKKRAKASSKTTSESESSASDSGEPVNKKATPQDD